MPYTGARRRMDSRFKPVLEPVRDYYAGKVLAHGAVHTGVDWNSRESQELRFEQLLKVCDTRHRFSLNDYGCGYGQLFEYMTAKGLQFEYSGFDISGEMIREAENRFGSFPNCRFATGSSTELVCDYTVASGVFNVRLSTPEANWLKYILSSLELMDRISRKGFAFNCLTKYSDREHMKEYLYYSDPCFLFDHCKRKYSRDVALLHDYGLYEFTIIVRKQTNVR